VPFINTKCQASLNHLSFSTELPQRSNWRIKIFLKFCSYFINKACNLLVSSGPCVGASVFVCGYPAEVPNLVIDLNDLGCE